MEISFRYMARKIKRAIGINGPPKVFFIVPESNWILDWVAHYIVQEMPKYGLEAQATSFANKLVGQIVHFSSLWQISSSLGSRTYSDNKVVGTIFHGRIEDPAFGDVIGKVLDNEHQLAKLHTASRIMENRLITWGVPRDKLVRIPLGIDLDLFKLGDAVSRRKKRSELGIAPDRFVIGSFHKDGVGVGEGFEPKLIKGPDVFLEVIDELSRNYKLHILLSAPARGYVKRGLDQIGVPYTHMVFSYYPHIAEYYHALDAYLVASREEGGPAGVLEAMASGVPLVTTNVGLSTDVATDGETAMICNVEDVKGLTDALARIHDDEDFRNKLVANAARRIQAFDWPSISARYYHELYAPLVKQL